MKILIINPNTSESFTDKIRTNIQNYKLPTTNIIVKTASSGPESIESIYDELLSAQGTLEIALQNMNDCDGIVIACYSDHPTVYALREITDIPVLGIAESSMYLACMVGTQFSIVTTNREWESLLWDAVKHFGLADRCASVRSLGLPVLALENYSTEEIYSSILEIARKCVDVDNADVICLGCAGMTGFDKRISSELDVPVIDGVVSAVKLIEALDGYQIRTSKRLAYARPRYKNLIGLPPLFKNGYI